MIELVDSSTNRVYPLYIKLPRSYKHSKEKSYPVIYLTDAWYAFQIVSGATRFPMNSGAMEEAIIVAIAYEHGSIGPSSRIRDYTPIKTEGWKNETGGALAYINFINNSVFKHIEKNYRVNNDKTFVGNSLGGLLAAYILFTQPDMFGNYIIGSPSVWFHNNYLLSLDAKPPKSSIKVYLAVGELEIQNLM